MVHHQSVLLISLIKTIKSQNYHIMFEGKRVLGLKVRIFRFFLLIFRQNLISCPWLVVGVSCKIIGVGGGDFF